MIIKKVICDNCRHECTDYITFYLPDKVEYRDGANTHIERGSKIAQVCNGCLNNGFKVIDLRRV